MKFTRAPEIVDAVQYTDNVEEVQNFCELYGVLFFVDEFGPHLHSLNKDIKFNVGDYLVNRDNSDDIIVYNKEEFESKFTTLLM